MSDWNPATDFTDKQVEQIICDVLCDSGSVNPQPIQFTRNKVRARINALLVRALPETALRERLEEVREAKRMFGLPKDFLHWANRRIAALEQLLGETHK